MVLTTIDRTSGIPRRTPLNYARVDGAIDCVAGFGSISEVKRCNNPAVEIAPSTHLGQPRGPASTASARILPVGEQPMAEQFMNTKYGWQKRFFAHIWRLQRQEHSYIEITPTDA